MTHLYILTLVFQVLLASNITCQRKYIFIYWLDNNAKPDIVLPKSLGTVKHMIFYRPMGIFVWKCKGCLTYACCNSLLFPVDVQYSTQLKRQGTCCVLRPDLTADLNHPIRLVSILNPNKNTVVRGGVQATCFG